MAKLQKQKASAPGGQVDSAGRHTTARATFVGASPTSATGVRPTNGTDESSSGDKGNEHTVAVVAVVVTLCLLVALGLAAGGFYWRYKSSRAGERHGDNARSNPYARVRALTLGDHPVGMNSNPAYDA